MVTELEFGDYLKHLRLGKKMTLNQLAFKSGISTSQISRIETGVRGIPKPDTIKKLAEALNIPYEEMMQKAGYIESSFVDYLETLPKETKEIINNIPDLYDFLDLYSEVLYGDPDRWKEAVVKPLMEKLPETVPQAYIEEVYENVKKIPDIFRNLSYEKKFKLLFPDYLSNIKEKNITFDKAYGKFVMDYLHQKTEKNPETIPYVAEEMRHVPVLGSIRAGEPIDRIEHNEGYTLVDPELLRGREGFALRVKGDSMSGDRILEGDIVIVLKQEEVEPSDIAVVAINGDEATLKRVKLHGDMVMLTPSNSAYEPQLLPAMDVSIIGKVVEVKFWPNKGGQ